MIHIVIPAAGEGSRFKEAGYSKPKPDIDVLGKPMIERVKDNLRPYADHYFTVIRKEDLKSSTGGAVETILNADIKDSEPLLIANCDQLISVNTTDFINAMQPYDGGLITFKSNKPHHSYVRLSEGVIGQIVEKEVISNEAVTGVYYFKRGKIFTDYANQVIKDNVRVKGEYYVSTVLDRMIQDGVKLGTYNSATAILGTPSELQLFESAVKVGKLL